jgi:hypothetical protein
LLISHQKKFIFIKTRKTAGTSIEGVLQQFATPPNHPVTHAQPFMDTEHGVVGARGLGGQTDDPLWAHSSASEIEKYLGKEQFRTYTKIYSVRNPFDKVVSWFWHVAPHSLRDDLANDPEKTKWYFRNWLLMRPILPRDRKLYKINGKIFEAKIIRYENLNQDLESLSFDLGLGLSTEAMPEWKRGSRKNKGLSLTQLYDKSTADAVRRAFSFDFSKFGYDKKVPE